jgi:hypothetical protein
MAKLPHRGERMSDSPAHVVVESGTMRGICQHCGSTFQLKLPCDIEVWIAAAQAFGKLHRTCPKPKHGDEIILANASEDALESF